MTPLEIKATLILKGITQVSIAQKVGVTPPLVSLVIQGKEKNLRVRQAIAEAIGCSVEEVWGPNKDASASAM